MTPIFHPRTEVVMKIQDPVNGVARFVRAPRYMTERSMEFVNPRFKTFPRWQLVKATFNVSPKMRMLIRVEVIPDGVDHMTIPLLGSENVPPTSTITTPVPPTPPAIVEKRAGWVGNIYFSLPAITLFDTAVAMCKSHPVNILMVGPSGYGKTTLPSAIAMREGMKYLRINCASVRDPEEWFGYREAKDGTTVFVPTEFTTTIRDGNAVVVLDEFNRVEPWLHNTLYPLLDDDRKTTVHGEQITCGPNLIFVATINDGAQFTGTFALDAAITNRMDAVLPVKALPMNIEVELVTRRVGELLETFKLVELMNKLRTMVEQQGIEVDASTRSTLKIARLIKAGMKPRHAIEFAFTNAVPAEQRKNVVDLVNTIFTI